MNPESNEETNAPVGRSFKWVIGGVTLTAIALTVWFVVALVRAVPPPALDVGETATVLRVPLPVEDFLLVDHKGREFDPGRLEDHWSFLFFGYTSCPAVCPMTLGNLSDVKKLVDGDPDGAGENVQFVFVSVDPGRDSVERLNDFVPYFNTAFIGATGTPEQLETFTKSLGIYYHEEEGASERDYLVDHTTSVMLIDPERRLHAIFPAPHDPGAVAEAFRKIREHRS